MDALVHTLSFLSDDDYEFVFQQHPDPPQWWRYLDFPDAPDPVSGVAEVMLFSGGLDALAGAVDEILVQKRKIALVSHRPVSKLDRRQTNLVQELSARAEPKLLAPFHVPVLANKKEFLGRDFTQRTRSFLFASFAAIVARLFNLTRVRFYENGIVSCNLPICAQVLGGRASRTTHPQVLHGFERLFAVLFETPFVVENPFFWKTRTDVISGLRATGHADLAAQTVSCAHTWQASADQPHCGTCSQCVDRRLAALAARLSEAQDPPSRYRTDLLTGQLEDVAAQTMVERIVGTAREVEKLLGPLQFLQRFGEATRLLRQLPGSPAETAVALFELHRRHARDVNDVIGRAISERVKGAGLQTLPSTCLLSLLAAPQQPSAAGRGGNSRTFVPTSDDLRILDALGNSGTTLLQVEIETSAGVSRRTITKRLREMLRCNLIRYPHGSRKGCTLTDDGQRLWQSHRHTALTQTRN
jgi:hypothetical protein